MRRFLALSFVCSLFANPTDPQVILGEAVLSETSTGLNIQTGDQTVLHWKDFSIEKGELTRFIQPSNDAVVLNRVVGGDVSKIYGQLHANGKVFLINPHGIIVGEDGLVDTASFLATTLDCLDRDLLRGEDVVFQGGISGRIINLGVVRANGGDVFLIAHQVSNQGVIESPNGVAGLAAGFEVLLQPKGQQKLFIRPSAKEGASIEQSGEIAAIQTEIKANGNPYDFAIRQSGKINAKGVERRDGRIFLVAEKGKVEQGGQLIARNGGEVRVLGDEVWLSDGEIDVSGESGGTVLIGGDLRGENPDVYNAKKTVVDRGVVIRADALANGDGGRVIIWSEENTVFRGDVSAKGGLQKGDGGFVEVSGGSLEYKGTVTTRALNGNPGTLLLDPGDVTINVFGGLGSSNLAYPTTAGPTDFYNPPDPGPGDLAAADIVNSLDVLGNNVIVQTSAGTFGTGIITVLTDVVWTSGRSLSLQADDSIYVAASILNNGLGSMTLTAVNEIRVGLDNTISPAAQKVMVGSYNGSTILTTTGGLITIGDVSSTFPSQVGYGDISTGSPMTGPIVINAATMGGIGSVGLIGGNDAAMVNRAFAQIGHGEVALAAGASTSFDGANATINVTANGGGGVFLQAGDSNESYVQIGHGGAFLANPTANDIGGAITVIATTGPIALDVGIGIIGTSCLARLGHGGIGDGTNVNSALFSGDITVTAGSNISMVGGAVDFNLVQIGHGISSTVVPGSATTNGISGAINIRSNAGFFSISGGVEDQTFCQVGHGGLNFVNDTADVNGDILIGVTLGPLTVTGGGVGGAFNSSAIGHGGVCNGIGTPTANTMNTSGSITITAQGDIDLAGGLGSRSQVQVGHGQNSSLFNGLQGSISLTSSTGRIHLEGRGGIGFSQVGHGGFAVSNTTNPINGIITVEATAGIIELFGSTAAFASSARIGHGGLGVLATSSSEPISGLIDVHAGSNITMLGGSLIANLVQIGHGISTTVIGAPKTNGISGDIRLTSDTGFFSFLAGSANNTLCQVGHGGLNFNNDTAIVTGAISLMAPMGTLTLEGGTGASIHAPSIIGHGGAATGVITGNTMNTTGGITISARGDINLTGGQIGGTSVNYAQIGHGQNDSIFNGLQGAISVTASTGSVFVTAGVDDRNFSQIGHGGSNVTNMTNDISGTIGVTATLGGIQVAGGLGGTGDAPARIGHGGLGTSGTIVGNTAITSGGTLSLNGGLSDNNGAYIESMGGTLTINVSSGDLVLTAGSALLSQNCVAEISSLDTQIINAPGGGLTLTQGAGDFAYARIGVTNNNQTITVRDDITLQADTTGLVAIDTGAVIENLFIGANTQSVSSTLGSILLSADLGSAANAPTARINNKGSAQIIQARTGIDLVNNNSGTSGGCVVKIGGLAQSVTVTNGNLTVTGGDSPTCGSELGSNSQIINVPQGFITLTGGAGVSSIAQLTALSGSQLISCSGTLTLQGGAGTNATARILHTIAGTQTINIGQNLILQAGSGSRANAFIIGVFAQSIILGGDLQAIGGPGPLSSIAAIRTALGGDTTITSTGGSVIFRNGTPQTNGAFLESITVFPVLPVYSGAGVNVTAAGDIAIANDLSSMGAIAFNANSTGSGQGAFLIDTRPYPSFAGVPGPAVNGITLTTTTGDITLRAASKFANGSPADFLISIPSDLSYLPLQPCLFTTMSGNILVDPFRDVIINTAMITLGDITVLADNDIILTAIGSATSANTTLVVDEQGQGGLIGGIWDPSGGDFILNAGATVVGTSTLRIFTAVRPNNTITGAAALNGVMFVPGALFVDTGTEQWFTYFGGPNNAFIGPNYIVFYKNFPPSLFAPLLTTASAEVFTMCDPYDNFLRWSLNFTEKSEVDFLNNEPYTINRRNNAELHNPKTDRVKKWDE